MEFKEFRNKIQEHFAEMVKDVTHLFEVEVDKDEMWNTYLDSYPTGTNEIFRKRREYDCSCCRQFIKNIGNVVVIKDNAIITIWDLDLGDEKFQPVADAMAAFIRSKEVANIYFSKFEKIGTEYNFEQYEDGTMKRWEHFQITLPSKFVDKSGRSIGDIQGRYRDTRNVFKRSLDEITEDSIMTVLELISQNSLYKGEEWKGVLTEFNKYKKEYDKLSSDVEKELYAWEQSVKAGMAIGRIRNHSMGTLLVNISEGMELDTAVKKYEQITAPTNYKRSKPIFTKKILEDAQKTITELGYLDSLQRRFATLDDITVNNILFSNKDSAKRISGAMDIFGEMAKDVTINPKKFSKVEEISSHDFINNVLPTAQELEIYLENQHTKNFVSLIAPTNGDAKTMFKWNNGLSWAYTGNITDSDMKINVKNAGGKVDGDLRFSIQWNECGTDNCDMDAHCKEASGEEIYFGHKRSCTQGTLDVDIIHPDGKVAVENITWVDRKTMTPGTYRFFVHQFSGNSREGVRAEIEFDGQIYTFDYPHGTRDGENIQIAEVTLNKNRNFTIKELLPSSVSSKEMWNVRTNQFVPVSVVCYSPNYFDEQDGIGHRHLMFMLKDCKNPENPNGYYNEYLKNELYEHRKVFEALGAKCRVEDAEDQLSGIGFSMTKRAKLIVKVKGATERVVKVKF